MKKTIFTLSMMVLLILPFAADARGGGGGGRGGGFSGARSGFGAPRVTPTAGRVGGFQAARTVTHTPSARQSSYLAGHTTVNNYGGYGGGSGFFSGYMMGSFMHPFGFGYGMYGGGYGYGMDATGGAYYPSTGAMFMSWILSIIFLCLLVWLVIFLITL